METEQNTLNNLKTPYELFGVECGLGWLPLVKKAITLVARYNGINRPHKIYGPVQFTQIKEKFGKLCIYLNYCPTKYLQEEIQNIEKQSLYICEHCGSTKSVTTEYIDGWVYTRCYKCRQEMTKK